MGSRFSRRDGCGSASGMAIQQSRRHAGRDPAIGRGTRTLFTGRVRSSGKVHANFYHDFMEDDELDLARPPVRDFVERMLDLNGSAHNGSER